MAAMLGAHGPPARRKTRGRPTVVLACVVNEEFGFTGATALTQLWTEGKRDLVPKKPDVCVVAEPTSLDIVVAHKGTMRRIHTHGKASHSSTPHLGDNAFYKMARVLLALEEYAKAVAL